MTRPWTTKGARSHGPINSQRPTPNSQGDRPPGTLPWNGTQSSQRPAWPCRPRIPDPRWPRVVRKQNTKQLNSSFSPSSMGRYRQSLCMLARCRRADCSAAPRHSTLKASARQAGGIPASAADARFRQWSAAAPPRRTAEAATLKDRLQGPGRAGDSARSDSTRNRARFPALARRAKAGDRLARGSVLAKAAGRSSSGRSGKRVLTRQRRQRTSRPSIQRIEKGRDRVGPAFAHGS
jgi:hypothetical protein